MLVFVLMGNFKMLKRDVNKMNVLLSFQHAPQAGKRMHTAVSRLQGTIFSVQLFHSWDEFPSQLLVDFGLDDVVQSQVAVPAQQRQRLQHFPVTQQLAILVKRVRVGQVVHPVAAVLPVAFLHQLEHDAELVFF